jgi:multicomponent Na+:H+ antiporter subunit E
VIASIQRLMTPGWLPAAAGMVVLWCALWGNWSVANVLSGVAIVTVARSAGLVPSAPLPRFRPMMRLLGFVLVDLVRSTVVVAAEVLTPTDSTDETIIRVDTDVADGLQRFVMVVAITLTPGTAVVGVEEGCIEMHLLHRERTDELIEHVRELTALVDATFGHRPGGAA